MARPFARERQLAISAVRRACALTDSVFNKLVKNETLTKGDKSPVTVGDYAAQALISSMLARAFPDDPIVGEEDSKDLRVEEGRALRERIVELANEAINAPLIDGDDVAWGIGPGQTKKTDEILDAIDRGSHEGGRNGRMWTIDPIDGTKGFLRGEQYAVCVSLIVDAQVQLGIIGCPNLPLDLSKPDSERGCIFLAIKGQGCFQLPLNGPSEALLRMPAFTPATLSFLESVEAAHSSHSTTDTISTLLGITKPPLRMDSQAKYGCLARGDGGLYLRMPTGVGYREKIWDHAPGSLLVEEAGGIVTDSRGERLDFGLGRTLGENFGVVAAGGEVHPAVLKAVQQANSAKAKV
ncbi:3'(2'),5'-bisphosphate nucleotidase [Mycena indigotica]|uniref:3'(2'),5'-bisphosphate nucleotidase n=1 Tax=Mycena indigotica TaxID=2126181 RepID=A0A8H6WAC1_9AGAR|nr:3'(2'),5'-bisphosphate nucleotidase [Mycena indigotica]KAF7307488.1 3'(2'),5'-bisphosphate nucleotidase [Mycena indigotica]